MSDRFHWVTSRAMSGPSDCDQDLLDDARAAVIPTVGSILPGWILVVPRKRVLSYAMLTAPERKELLELAKSIDLAGFGERTYFFEHGPSSHNSSMGCGVDQAHLHVLSTNNNIMPLVLSDPQLDWSSCSSIDPWSVLAAGRDYYLFGMEREFYFAYAKEPISQYFRRRIATAAGQSDKWKYQDWPFHDNCRQTIDYFQKGRHVARNECRVGRPELF